jgi:hypothetical protein
MYILIIGHLLTPLPGAMETKPGSAALPFFGIKPEVLDPNTGEILHGIIIMQIYTLISHYKKAMEFLEYLLFLQYGHLLQEQCMAITKGNNIY